MQSTAANYLYLCITKNGEMFFGRYADYDKPNYCEYIVAESAAVSNELSQICQTGINGYINQNAVDGIPKCSEWALGYVTKAAEKSFIPTILLELNFSESAKRIDFCRMAYRMLNEKEQINVIERTHPFTDVDKDERELAYLYENGIINRQRNFIRMIPFHGKKPQLSSTGCLSLFIKQMQTTPIKKNCMLMIIQSAIGLKAAYIQ